ncbi:hypothetical protein [Streptoalloteichus hindustanus]|uniref:Uncharacterized protein n=1 Tax=Streptoalloteichus hindustanus TaxID=2017 RepID=A0A1M5I988_STRHI|nr:hypothetical protein [Streptoalloteichus hindustanus]SHG24797.1 hypothetical protein SAMN05444320_107172 [Streptoalloteichus hindustanus]
MAGVNIKQSGRLFLANGARKWYAFTWNGSTLPSHWIRPSVNHNQFSARQAQLRYVEERVLWDANAQWPPAWALNLEGIQGDSEFLFTIVVVTP